MPELRVEISARFKSEAEKLLGSNHEYFVASLEWVLRRRAEMGQRLRGSEQRIWPYYPDDGHVYLTYYSIADGQVRLNSLVKKATPISPKLLDLADD